MAMPTPPAGSQGTELKFTVSPAEKAREFGPPDPPLHPPASDLTDVAGMFASVSLKDGTEHESPNMRWYVVMRGRSIGYIRTEW